MQHSFIGKTIGAVKLIGYDGHFVFAGKCTKCGFMDSFSYTTVWHRRKSKGGLRCKNCLNPIGKNFGGILIVAKFGTAYLGTCSKNHSFVCNRARIHRSEKLNAPIRCPGCVEENKIKKLGRKKRSTLGLKKNAGWKRWCGMMSRCRRGYSNVCERWKNSALFLQDMGNPPPNTVLDRIDNKKGYEPSNCRWATFKKSTENRRSTVWLKYKNKKYRVSEFAKFIGSPASRVYLRLYYGWTVEQIASKPNSMNGFDRYGNTINPRANRLIK